MCGTNTEHAVSNRILPSDSIGVLIYVACNTKISISLFPKANSSYMKKIRGI